MRALLVILLIGMAADDLRSQRPSPLDARLEPGVVVSDPSRRDVCAAWETIAQIASHARMHVGFENAPNCRLGGSGAPDDHDLRLEALTLRTAFDRFVELRPEFAWKVVGGHAVIRPAASWEAPNDTLRRPVGPFTLERVHPHHALHALLQSAQPTLFMEHTDVQLSSVARRAFDSAAKGEIDRPITVQFAGGSLLHALNTVTAAVNGTWQVAFTGDGMDIALWSWDVLSLDGGVTSIHTHPDLFDYEGKRRRRRAGATSNPFVDPAGYKEAVHADERVDLEQLQRERSQPE